IFMKKTIINLAVFAAVGLSTQVFGQQEKTQGAVGVNIDKPHATFEVKTFDESGNSVEGFLIPRVTSERAKAMGENVAESTMVYITNKKADGENDTTISLVDTKGFYYFAEGKWQKVGAAATTTKEFTARLGQTTGSNYDWKDGDKGYVDFYEFTTDGGAIILPDPTLPENKGRIIHFKNSTGGLINYTGTMGVSYPDRTNGITASSAQMVWSNGTKWYLIGGRN
ncbi:hypothetical protein, partial [Riemerella columbina]|uniref:hypothetical protein n=1 Tax=Riemerella columbina TaxID=103810 RepID=UPI001C86D72A